MAYSEKVMDHFANPRNVGEIPDADGVGEVGNPTCGDIMKMYLKIKDGVITDVKFKTFGCGAAIATSSMATEGLPPVKVHCSVLAEQAIKAALSDYYTRIGVDPLPIVGPVAECSHEDGSCSCGL